MSDFRSNKREDSKADERPREAQRQFNYSSTKTPPSLSMHQFLVVAYWLAPTLAILLIIVSGIIVAIKLQPKYTEPVEQDMQPFNLGASGQSLPKLSTIGRSRLLNAYFDAHGGRNALANVRSMRMEGVFREGSKARAFQLIVSYPDKGSLIFDPRAASREQLILNGSYAWSVFEEDGKRRAKRLNQQQAKEFRRFSRLHDPIRDFALGGQGSILFISEVVFDGVACYKITKEREDRSIIECYLDRESFYLIATLEAIDVEGESKVRKVNYSDHRAVAGVVEPFRSSVFLGDELVNELSIQSIQINPGVMSSIFSLPEDLIQ